MLITLLIHQETKRCRNTKNRSEMKIISEIRDVANAESSARQTRIMYRIFLRYEQLKQYLLPILMDNYLLLRYDEETQTFKITGKGVRFLQIYNEIVNVIGQNNNRSRHIDKEEDLTDIRIANRDDNNDKPLARLLVVDDDSDIVQVLKMGLLQNGFSVEAFTNPQEALDSFKSRAQSYNLILSDIKMPELSGIELARKVKEINPKVKVVLITALEIRGKEFSKEFRSGRIDSFVQKPIGIGELTNKILSLLGETTREG
jgi:CheY-like chemotaxis protein/predicted transcriptional regulator